jgi:hypothetical protein
MNDLISGVLPVDANELSAEEVWDICYQHMEEFINVVFSQFNHRKQVGANVTCAGVESAALACCDRLLFPRQTENHHGEPVFNLHPAKLLLCGDVNRGIHVMFCPFRLFVTAQTCTRSVSKIEDLPD